MSLQRNIVAVGVGDGDVKRRARRHVQREGLSGARPRDVVFIEGPGADGAVAFDIDRDVVGVPDGMAIHVLARGGIVLVQAERVVKIFLSSSCVAHVFTILAVGAVARAVEGAVTEGSVVVAYQSAHIGVVVGHVACHAAELNRAVVLAGDATHTACNCNAGVLPVGTDVAGHPAILYRAVVLAGDAAHQSRRAAMDVGYHVDVLHPTVRSDSGKQALVVVRNVLDVDADGVAVAVEGALVVVLAPGPARPFGPSQRNPRHGVAHVDVGLQRDR